MDFGSRGMSAIRNNILGVTQHQQFFYFLVRDNASDKSVQLANASANLNLPFGALSSTSLSTALKKKKACRQNERLAECEDLRE